MARIRRRLRARRGWSSPRVQAVIEYRLGQLTEPTRGVAGVAAGGFAAYLVHTGLDWDWEMPAVTLTGLLCGVGLLAVALPVQRRIAIGPRGRTGLALAIGALVALALVARAVTG